MEAYRGADVERIALPTFLTLLLTHLNQQDRVNTRRFGRKYHDAG